MKQPKHVDVAKPCGYIKRKLQRWNRAEMRRDTATQIMEYINKALEEGRGNRPWEDEC